jgi:5'-3' exonuclease
MKQGFKLHPTGNFRATITSIEQAVSKAGNDMLVVQFDTDCDFKYGLKDWVMLKSKGLAGEKREAFKKVFGIKTGDAVDLEALVGESCNVFIEHDGGWTRVHYESDQQPPSQPAIKDSDIPF